MRTHLLATLMLALCGCASSGAKIDTAQLTEVRNGQTTVAEIVKRFGRPTVLSKNWDGTQTVAYANTGGESDDGTLFPLIGAVAVGARTSVETVIFYFDTSGVLTGYKTTQPQGARFVQPIAAAPVQTSAGTATQTSISKPASTRPDTTKKDGGTSKLPWWLPSEIRDTRQ